MSEFGSEGHEHVDVGAELRASRLEPPAELVSAIASRVRPDRQLRPAAPRLAFAAAASVAVLALAAAFGGVSEAASTIQHAATAVVHIGQKTKPHKAPATKAPIVASTSAGATASSSAQAAATGDSPVPPRSGPRPADDQYVNPGCNPSLRGPYIACRVNP